MSISLHYLFLPSCTYLEIYIYSTGTDQVQHYPCFTLSANTASAMQSKLNSNAMNTYLDLHRLKPNVFCNSRNVMLQICNIAYSTKLLLYINCYIVYLQKFSLKSLKAALHFHLCNCFYWSWCTFKQLGMHFLCLSLQCLLWCGTHILTQLINKVARVYFAIFLALIMK